MADKVTFGVVSTAILLRAEREALCADNQAPTYTVELAEQSS